MNRFWILDFGLYPYGHAISLSPIEHTRLTEDAPLIDFQANHLLMTLSYIANYKNSVG